MLPAVMRHSGTQQVIKMYYTEVTYGSIKNTDENLHTRTISGSLKNQKWLFYGISVKRYIS